MEKQRVLISPQLGHGLEVADFRPDRFVYRQADGKTRNVHGATTVERTKKEARVAERKRKRYLNGLLADAGIMDADVGSMQAQTSAPAQAPAQAAPVTAPAIGTSAPKSKKGVRTISRRRVTAAEKSPWSWRSKAAAPGKKP